MKYKILKAIILKTLQREYPLVYYNVSKQYIWYNVYILVILEVDPGYKFH
jgi:hypothetical protein